MHPKNGSSLSLDYQLCLPLYLSSFLPFPILCCHILELFGVLSLYSRTSCMEWTQSTKRVCPSTSSTLPIAHTYYTVPWSFSSRFDISIHHSSCKLNHTLRSCHVVSAQHLDPGLKCLDDRRLGDRKTRDPPSASQSVGRLSGWARWHQSQNH